jgi:hypothetical protein
MPVRDTVNKVDPFVYVPLWWAAAAAKHTRSPDLLVCIELLHARWRNHSMTFPFANVRLRKAGVSHKVKGRVLRDLERGGLITVERRSRKTPIVTLVLL